MKLLRTEVGEVVEVESECQPFKDVAWHMSQMLILVQRSCENAEHEGRTKERLLIAEYLELMGLPAEAKDVRDAAHLKMLPKERKSDD